MKKIYKIFIIILFIVMSILLVLSFLKINKLEEEISDLTKEERTEVEINETEEISDAEKDLFNTLITYAETFLEDDKYKTLEKKNDVYFISLKELNEKYGFDISIFKDSEGNVCSIEDSGIYFDNEQKMHQNSDNEYFELPVLYDCFGLNR